MHRILLWLGMRCEQVSMFFTRLQLQLMIRYIERELRKIREEGGCEVYEKVDSDAASDGKDVAG